MIALFGAWLAAFGAAQLVPGTQTPMKVVDYDGIEVSVPASWPVIDLAATPAQCVRFDRSAVYLGREGDNPDCPAHLVGRADGLQIEPIVPGTTPAATHTITVDGEPVQVAPFSAASGESVEVLAAQGVQVIFSYAPHGSVTQHIAAKLTITSGTVAAPAQSSPEPAAATAAPEVKATAGLTIYTGEAFDACTAPSLSTMSAWRSASPYQGIGIYLGGVNAACAQPNLTSAWVSSVEAAGWSLIPTYVGLQAPCNAPNFYTIDPSNAAGEGTAAADDAIAQAASVGIGGGNPIYFDMEAYPTGGSCTQAVLAFLDAWTAELRANGYLSGIYSSAASGIADLVANTGVASPDDIWFADWNGDATVFNDPYIPNGDWYSHQRIHQYAGGHNETWGAVTINIDSDYSDGAVAQGSASTTTPPGMPTAVSATAANATAKVSWSAPSQTGSDPILHYIVTAAPGAASTTVAATARTATVRGLKNGTTYTFTVAATSAAGTGAASAPSNPVTPGPPTNSITVTSVTPGDLGPGATATVTIVGTSFHAGATITTTAGGVTAATPKVVSGTKITVKLTIAATAPAGSYDVTVANTAGGSATCTGCLTIDAAPAITSVQPSGLAPGATNQIVTLTGTNFVAGLTATIAGSKITLVSTAYVSATSITLTVDVAAKTPAGHHTITVTNPDLGQASAVLAVT